MPEPVHDRKDSRRPRQTRLTAKLTAHKGTPGIGLVLTLLAAPAHAHDAAGPMPAAGDVLLPAVLAMGAVLYFSGVVRLWVRAGYGRGVPAWRVGCYACGAAVCMAVLVGPVAEWAAHSFSGHMVQHIILMLTPVALLGGRPLTVALHAVGTGLARPLGRIVRRPVWRRLGHPGVAAVAQAIALWSWHVPAAFIAAENSWLLHSAEHLTFVMASALFWYAVLRPQRFGALGRLAGLFGLFATLMHTGLLGALIALAPRPLYRAPAGGADGLSLLADQQLAGLIMWMPAGAAYLVAALLSLAQWLSAARGPQAIAAGRPS